MPSAPHRAVLYVLLLLLGAAALLLFSQERRAALLQHPYLKSAGLISAGLCLLAVRSCVFPGAKLLPFASRSRRKAKSV